MNAPIIKYTYSKITHIYIMSDPPPKADALFSVGNKVQISWKYNIPVYRGQTGIINKMKRKGGSGKLKDNWVYSITIDGSAFENKENGTL